MTDHNVVVKLPVKFPSFPQAILLKHISHVRHSIIIILDEGIVDI